MTTGTQNDRANGIFTPAETVRAVLASSAEKAFANALRAVILTGSLARNEATFVPAENGFRLLGDCDLLLLFQDNEPLPTSAEIQTFQHATEEALANVGISAPVSASAIHSDYLQKLDPTIFAYELRTNGVVLCGDEACLAGIPGFTPDQIPLDDAWRMLCNRMVECLEHASSITETDPRLTPELAQTVAKLYLDMTTSLLLFLKRYRPTYGERLLQLEQLTVDQPSALPFSGHEFLQHVRAFTQWKLAPESSTPADLESLKAGVAYAHLLYRWELERLTDTSNQATDLELSDRWARKQGVKNRLRGWGYVVRACSRSNYPKTWLRWLLLFASRSPRQAVYDTGAELFFRLPCILSGRREANWDRLRKKLPVSNSTSGEWSELARDVVWNYKTFLVGTRA
jgi:hypothetical protein